MPLLLTTSAQAAPARPELALTFDDGTESPEINAAILRALDQAGRKSAIFVAGKNVDSAGGWAQVRAWGEAGHLVGNHSYSHRDLGDAATDLADFEADVSRNQTLLQKVPGFTRIFRYPYLKEGETAAKRDGFRGFLRDNGYRHGAVTIDASDWYYDVRFRAWQKAHPGADPEPFRAAYLTHLRGRAAYYERLGRKVIGRSIKHVLLLHTNAINAAFLPDVIAMFQQSNWKLIDARAAFEDPIYAVAPRNLPAGESLIWAVAKAKGEQDLRHPGESDVYEKPLLDAAGL